jgi:hypothetical protein
LQTELLDSGLERNLSRDQTPSPGRVRRYTQDETYEVMKLAASSYPEIVETELAEPASDDASSTTGNVDDTGRAAFLAFLAAFFLATFFFWLLDKPPPSTDGSNFEGSGAFLRVTVDEGRSIPIPLTAGLWEADV